MARARKNKSVLRQDGAVESAPVQRWDGNQQLPKAHRTPEGYLKAPATRVARTGIQEYRREDGSIQRELRLDSEVFASDSLETLDGKPVVHRHPGEVNAVNARKHSRGVATSPRQDGEFILADLLIHDADLIRAADRGDSEISLGYKTVLVPIQGGVFRQDGHPFNESRADFLQTKIVYNHVALIDRGRANEGTSDRPVKIRLDSSNNIVKYDETSKRTNVKIKINGVEFDVEDNVASAIEAQNSNHASQIQASKKETETASARADSAEKKLDQETARADVAESKIVAIESKKDDVVEQEKRAVEEAARFELMSEAKATLKIDVSDLAKLSSNAIKKRIVAVRSPELRLDGKSDDYVDAMFDALRVKPKNPAAQLAQAISRGEHAKREDGDISPLAKRHREISEKHKTSAGT